MSKLARNDNDDAVDRRSRILDGARAAFMRYGFERSSMADIAAGAGVSRTALYQVRCRLKWRQPSVLVDAAEFLVPSATLAKE